MNAGYISVAFTSCSEFLRLDAVVYTSMLRSTRRFKDEKRGYITWDVDTCVDENSLRGVNDECETAGRGNEDLN